MKIITLFNLLVLMLLSLSACDGNDKKRGDTLSNKKANTPYQKAQRANEQYRVNASALILRSGASIKSKKVGIIPIGGIAQLIDKQPVKLSLPFCLSIFQPAFLSLLTASLPEQSFNLLKELPHKLEHHPSVRPFHSSLQPSILLLNQR